MAEQDDTIDTDILADDAQELATPEKLPQDKTEETPAPVKADDQTPEPKGEDDEVEVEETNRGRFVRHGAFHAEREQRKQWQQRAREVEAELARKANECNAFQAAANERLAHLFTQAQQQQGQQTQAPPPPDKDQDPLGYIMHKLAVLEQGVGKVDGLEKQSQAERERAENFHKITNFVREDENRFRQANADYDQALDHLKGLWIAEANLAGVDPNMALMARIQENLNLAGRANKSPAELAYARAKALGYKPGTPNGQAQQQAGPSLETLKAGLKHDRNPSGSTPAPTGAPTIDQLLNMSDDEFFAKIAGNDDKFRATLAKL